MSSHLRTRRVCRDTSPIYTMWFNKKLSLVVVYIAIGLLAAGYLLTVVWLRSSGIEDRRSDIWISFLEGGVGLPFLLSAYCIRKRYEKDEKL